MHRAFAGERDAAFVEARIAEVRRLLAAWDSGELGPGNEVGEVGTVEGYRRWVDLRHLPVADAHVDLVTCGLALTHLPDLGPAFAELARVLRPGGHLITADIHWLSLPLGGIASTVDDDGAEDRLPASR